MSAWKKRLIALALWVPFALYGVNAVSRVLELSAASFPTTPMPDRETAAKLKAITKSKAQAAQSELQSGAGYLPEENGTYKAALTERFSATENARQFNEEKP